MKRTWTTQFGPKRLDFNASNPDLLDFVKSFHRRCAGQLSVGCSFK
jgi:hypothetical protein